MYYIYKGLYKSLFVFNMLQATKNMYQMGKPAASRVSLQGFNCFMLTHVCILATF